MTGACAETIRWWLGWCPLERPMQTNMVMDPRAGNNAEEGTAGGPAPSSAWAEYVHNVLLGNAIGETLGTIGLFLLLAQFATITSIQVGIGIGVVSSLFLWPVLHRRYARMVAGAAEDHTARLRRYAAGTVPAGIIIAVIAYFGVSGMFGLILAVFLGGTIFSWGSWLLTLLWERQHRQMVIARTSPASS
jgi:hypothetical protein